MTNPETIQVYIESPDGERFECDLPADMPLSNVAADFFEERSWPTTDSRGRGQRAVVELVDANNPDRTKRLRGEQTVANAGLWNGAILRIHPESIAGRLDESTRVPALVSDHRAMEDLVSWNRYITFKANREHAPFEYTVTFTYPSFVALSHDGHTPVTGYEHRVKIELGAEYPRAAPSVRWLTPIFHPNIHPENGNVCLGALRHRYLPGLGLGRLTMMLAEMVQWRNCDFTSALNKAAAAWAADTAHWPFIFELGGSPFQGPAEALLDDLAKLQSLFKVEAELPEPLRPLLRELARRQQDPERRVHFTRQNKPEV
ncbi:MAG: ubiquitin-conjugating enzyme E2 [Anaerolineae bacterium]|jgi:hypothetical protein|nr:ubiquitin-conjugating enzyme E2 [Anaerolineae bacterium]